jgi:hypothetical protein
VQIDTDFFRPAAAPPSQMLAEERRKLLPRDHVHAVVEIDVVCAWSPSMKGSGRGEMVSMSLKG